MYRGGNEGRSSSAGGGTMDEIENKSKEDTIEKENKHRNRDTMEDEMKDGNKNTIEGRDGTGWE